MYEDERDTSVCINWLVLRKIEEAGRFNVVLWVTIYILAI